jgi:hypothetical protein
MAKTLGTIGKELNLKFRQGSTFGPYEITLNDPDGNPFDLTGYTFLGKIKKSYSSDVVLANVNITEVDYTLGKISMSIPSSGTSLCKGNPNGSSDYIWDLEMIDSNGSIQPLFYGVVESFSNA